MTQFIYFWYLIVLTKHMKIHLTLLCRFCCTIAFSTLSINLFEDLFLSTVLVDLFIGDTLAFRFLGSIFMTVLMMEIMLSSLWLLVLMSFRNYSYISYSPPKARNFYYSWASLEWLEATCLYPFYLSSQMMVDFSRNDPFFSRDLGVLCIFNGRKIINTKYLTILDPINTQINVLHFNELMLAKGIRRWIMFSDLN